MVLTHIPAVSQTPARCVFAQAEWTNVSAVRHPTEIRTVVRTEKLQD